MIEPVDLATLVLRRAPLEYYVPGGAGREGPSRESQRCFVGNHR